MIVIIYGSNIVKICKIREIVEASKIYRFFEQFMQKKSLPHIFNAIDFNVLIFAGRTLTRNIELC